MIVNYLHQYFTLPYGSGGTRSYEFARRWVANGKQVRIITSNHKLPADFQQIKTITRTNLEGIHLSIIPSQYSQTMSYTQRMREFLRFAFAASREAMRQPADVIYATSTPLTIAIPGIMGKMMRQIPLVMEIRDLWPEVPIAMGALDNPVLRQAACLLEWWAYHASAHVVALSPNMAQGVIRRGIDSQRVSIIPNSSDIEFFTTNPGAGAPIREKLQIPLEQPLIVYTGSFGYVNGITYLVEVAKHMQHINPSVCFLLVGDGVEAPEVLQRAEEAQILGHTLWVWKPVPKIEIPAILAAATIATSTVIPRQVLWNNSANKFFDALASGTPIAINHGGWLADLLTETGAGLVLPPDNPPEAAQLLADFVQNRSRVTQSAAAAAQLARERFDRDTLSQTVEHILESVVATS